eukprot:1589187-Prymnesium_polylepis.1
MGRSPSCATRAALCTAGLRTRLARGRTRSMPSRPNGVGALSPTDSLWPATSRRTKRARPWRCEATQRRPPS